MSFGEPLELPDGCVLLRPRTGMKKFQELRRSILGKDAISQDAHLTLLHSRNATGALHDLRAIAREVSGLAIEFSTIALIEQHGCDPWHVRSRHNAAI